ncbi:MAG: FAD/NAD(P)-binding protein [Candidatus Omnitrophica bacterium]|nr:FAD/NAD(P)-binding protein [Candidatus Omnitrophota bacterium]MDD5352511.1 FAD/NAD(P)-binding protein [Candidatus Omnitrophota bacterium]MDD5550109.1 FAD/NAD(P)-binding protein [Candidatus Omnitrophota bacterium]
MRENNPYNPAKIELADVIEESSTIKTFVFNNSNGGFSFETGQFVELSVPGLGEAPFTPSSNPAVKEQFDITIMKVGKVTDKLHSLGKNTELGVRGPYGKGYPLQDFKGKEIYIVGGGVGLAPLRSLLFSLLNDKKDYKKIILRYGARTPNDIIYKKLVEQWRAGKEIDVRLTVDKSDSSWKGNVGVVTTILDKKDVDINNAVAVVCGPPIMMKFATFKLLEMGFKDSQLYLSMEKNMSCGIGKCGHCRVGNFYCCKDGPVFTYDKIKNFPEVWD